MINIYKELFEHVDEFWPDHDKEVFTWELGKIKNVLPDFSVVRITPKSSNEPWVYISHGAWVVGSNKGYRKEFFLMCPFENPRHIETLAMLASFYAESESDLDIGDSVNIGRNWLEGANCNHLLVSLPYPYGTNLELCKLEDFTVKYLWLLPISSTENTYLKSHGMEALGQKFDDAEIDFLDLARPSVV